MAGCSEDHTVGAEGEAIALLLIVVLTQFPPLLIVWLYIIFSQGEFICMRYF